MSFQFRRLSPVLVRRMGWHLPVGAWTYAHWCPGCKSMHDFAVDQPFRNGAQWSYRGPAEKPTFNPSMNIRIGPYSEGSGKPGQMDVCHYFIRDGQIQFLGDCTHAMKGITVPLEPIPANQMLGAEEVTEEES